jgi:hypothetical protein
MDKLYHIGGIGWPGQMPYKVRGTSLDGFLVEVLFRKRNKLKGVSKTENMGF